MHTATDDALDAFAAEMFALFDAHTRRVYIDGGEAKRQALLQFARLVAAYYLNLPTPSITAVIAKPMLPNLLSWTNSDWISDGDALARVFPRDAIAAAMPPTLTAGAVTRLLCACGAWLEAVHFVDHFNDFRAQILLRRIVDIAFGLNLFTEHCEQHLCAGILARICGAECRREIGDSLTALIRRHVDALVQLDVVFDTSLVARLKREAARLIADELAHLQDDDVDVGVHLPRPPIYMTPSEFDGASAEVLAWNRVHYLVQLLLACLARANRLETLVATVVAWILRAQHVASGDESELPYLMEGELSGDAIPDEDHQLFAKLVFCTLQMGLRDRISLFWRRHAAIGDCGDTDTLINALDVEQREEFALLERKYAALFRPPILADNEGGAGDADSGRHSISDAADLGGSPVDLLRRWMHTAMDGDDVTLLLNFLHFTKAGHPQTEKYLPVLNEVSATKWRATILLQITAHGISIDETGKDNATQLQEVDRFTVDGLEMQKLRFITDVMPSISLWEDVGADISPLIQITLRLRPHEFVRVTDDGMQFLEEDSLETTECSNKNKEDGDDDPIVPSDALATPSHVLLANIRASIRRLGSIRDVHDDAASISTATPPLASAKARRRSARTRDRAFHDLYADFQLERLRAEIQEQKALLSEFVSKAAPRSERRRPLDTPKRIAATSSRSLPTKFVSDVEISQWGNTIGWHNVNGKIGPREKARLSEISPVKSSRNWNNTRIDNVDTVSRHWRNVPPTPSTSRDSSGRYSDASSPMSTLSSERRLRAEIDDIGQRLSRLRDELRTPRDIQFQLQNRKINAASGDLSDDSALEPSAPPSAHGIAPLDLSGLHSSDEDTGKRRPYKWTEIEIFPRPSQNHTAPINNSSKREPANQSERYNSTQQRHQLPSWLRLLPPQRHCRQRGDSDSEENNGGLDNVALHYGTRPLLQLPRRDVQRRNNRKCEKSEKFEGEIHGEPKQNSPVVDRPNRTANIDSGILFASDMTRAEIEEMIRLAG